jgi:putative mRNA 3-end processing factor
MEISFQHTNPSASHDSTLLTVSPQDSKPLRYLIDAGKSVSPGAFIGPNESLSGIFLTHAHIDHYASLGQICSSNPETPLYASPPTAMILQQVYSEAAQYQGLENVDMISDALTPIDTWTPLADGVYVLPIPAGHTPGAAAFLFRIDDLEANEETVTVLATGDFTTRSVAGYPGLTIPGSIDIDILIANAATSGRFQEKLSEAMETILERGLGGANTLVAAGALTGVHVAYVLGHLAERLDRQLPIHLVGQGAKHYSALGYDVPGVIAHSHFDHTDEVLFPGAVTIAGPEEPTQGSTRRLFGIVKEDPDAVFVQLSTSNPETVEGVSCATHHFELSNHPTEQQFLDLIKKNLPRHLVLKHVGTNISKSLESSFENLFHWGNDDMNSHILYDDGTWLAPHWVSESGANLIRQRNYRESDARIPIDLPIDELPSIDWGRRSVELQTEGVTVDSLINKFESTEVQPSIQKVAATSDGGQTSTTPSSAEIQDGQDMEDKSGQTSEYLPGRVDNEFQSEVVDRLEAIESSLNNLASSSLVEETVEGGFEDLETHLEGLETRVETLPEQLTGDEPERVTGTVVRHEDLFLIRVDPDEIKGIDRTFAHEEQVEISFRFTESRED